MDDTDYAWTVETSDMNGETCFMVFYEGDENNVLLQRDSLINGDVSNVRCGMFVVVFLSNKLSATLMKKWQNLNLNTIWR